METTCPRSGVNRTDVIFDVVGWVSAPSESNQAFNVVTPTRVLDTRPPPLRAGVCDPPGCTRLGAGQNRRVQITGQAGIPAQGVRAVLVNVTAADPVGSGALAVVSGNLTPTSGSTLNYAGTTIANTTVVPLSPDGKITVANFFGSTDVVLDVQGFYADTATFTYTYDPTGLRRTKVAPDGTVTRFVWDRSGSLPLLVAEISPTSTTRYLYGPGGLAYAQVRDGVVEYLHHDQLGSTRVITNAAGATIGSLSFDAYGVPNGTTGTATTRLGYAGQYTDTETGYQYLRARYYDPATAQFLTRDPAVSLTREPYGYTGGDPLNRVDPSGLAPWDSLGGLFDDDFWCDLAGWGSQVSRVAGWAAVGLAATAFFVATPAGLVVAVGLVATAGSGAQLLGGLMAGDEEQIVQGTVGTTFGLLTLGTWGAVGAEGLEVSARAAAGFESSTALTRLGVSEATAAATSRDQGCDCR
jgi:RHS repeat-associated protein